MLGFLVPWDALGVWTDVVCRTMSGVGFIDGQLKNLNWDGLGVRTGMVCRPVSGVGFVGSQLKSLNWDGLGVWMGVRVCHHHHQFLNREGRWGTTDDFATSFLHFLLFSTVLWDLPNSRPVHSLMSSHLFLCLPCLLPPFTVPCKMVLARPNERET